MNIDFSNDELMLLDLLLAQEQSETTVEIHHSRNNVYKDLLREKLKMVDSLAARVQSALAKTP